MVPNNHTDEKSFVAILKNNDRPISEAVEAFTSLVDTVVKTTEEAEAEAPFWKAWHDLTTLAQQTHHTQQERLVEFVNEVRKQPGPFKDDGSRVKVWGEEMSWELLPLLGAELRECWNETPEDSKPFDEGWVNLNAFVAGMTAASSNGDSRDYSLYGIWALRDILEDRELSKNLPNKSLLQAACMWMIHAAPRLQDQAKENRSFEGKLAREGQTLLGKGWSGFSMDRWKLWHERLAEAKDMCEDEPTRYLLSLSIARM